MRFDDQRVADLQNIQAQIVYNFWQQKGSLPDTLDELNDDISGFRAPVDPASGGAYEYRRLGDLGFKLCAVFSSASQNQQYSLKSPERVISGPVKRRGLLASTSSRAARSICAEEGAIGGAVFTAPE